MRPVPKTQKQTKHTSCCDHIKVDEGSSLTPCGGQTSHCKHCKLFSASQTKNVALPWELQWLTSLFVPVCSRTFSCWGFTRAWDNCWKSNRGPLSSAAGSQLRQWTAKPGHRLRHCWPSHQLAHLHHHQVPGQQSSRPSRQQQTLLLDPRRHVCRRCCHRSCCCWSDCLFCNQGPKWTMRGKWS